MNLPSVRRKKNWNCTPFPFGGLISQILGAWAGLPSPSRLPALTWREAVHSWAGGEGVFLSSSFTDAGFQVKSKDGISHCTWPLKIFFFLSVLFCLTPRSESTQPLSVMGSVTMNQAPGPWGACLWLSLEGHGHLLSPLLGLTRPVVTPTSVGGCADCHFTQEDVEARKLLEPAPALVAAGGGARITGQSWPSPTLAS